MTGKPASGDGYTPSTVAHSETALRRFYDLHRDAGTGPVLNPFPLGASRWSRRAHAHRNPGTPRLFTAAGSAHRAIRGIGSEVVAHYS